MEPFGVSTVHEVERIALTLATLASEMPKEKRSSFLKWLGQRYRLHLRRMETEAALARARNMAARPATETKPQPPVGRRT